MKSVSYESRAHMLKNKVKGHSADARNGDAVGGRLLRTDAAGGWI